DLDIAPKILRDVEAGFFSAQRNQHATFASPATAGRRLEPHFRAGAAAFGRASYLVFGRLAERKDRFFKLDFFFALARLRDHALVRTARRYVPTKIRCAAAFEFDIGQAHRKISVLWIVREKPAI